jgi:hypothetical protein
LARLQPPRSAAKLARTAPIWHELPSGAALWRIYFRAGPHPMTWNAFRFYGPTAARFDHHTPPRREQTRGIYYAAESGRTCVAEVFQQTRVVDVATGAPALAAFRLRRSLRLLDLRGLWTTRAGASLALSTGSHPRARAWSRAIWSGYPEADGLWYASAMDGGSPSIALYERATNALPDAPALNLALAEPALRLPLARAAAELNYLLVVL